MVPSLIYLYRRMENTDGSVLFLQKYAYIYISSYQPLLRSSESACWRIDLTCLNLGTTCSCCPRLSTVLCTRHISGGAKLPSTVSSHFKRFHISKKHKFHLWKPFDISGWKRLVKSHTNPQVATLFWKEIMKNVIIIIIVIMNQALQMLQLWELKLFWSGVDLQKASA